MIAAVATNSFAHALARHLAAGRLDDALVHRRRGRSSSSTRILWVTVEVVFAVVLLALLIGVPAAYALARRDFPGKRAADAAVPAAADGAADHLRHSAGDGALQGAARRHDLRRDPRQPDSGRAVRHPGHDAVHRADRSATSNRRRACSAPAPAGCSGTCWCRCWRPGILAASLLVLVRTIALFELTFLTAGPDSQTLVVALYYAVFAAGVRAPQSVDAMAMIYMVVTLVVAADRAALRQPDAARQPRQGASADRMTEDHRTLPSTPCADPLGRSQTMTKTILCYGDSNTWGCPPRRHFGDMPRYGTDVRWGSVLNVPGRPLHGDRGRAGWSDDRVGRPHRRCAQERQDLPDAVPRQPPPARSGRRDAGHQRSQAPLRIVGGRHRRRRGGARRPHPFQRRRPRRNAAGRAADLPAAGGQLDLFAACSKAQPRSRLSSPTISSAKPTRTAARFWMPVSSSGRAISTASTWTSTRTRHWAA